MVNFFHIDAFSDRPFAGNPAAVCILESERPTEWLQSMAAEMNLSETAFLLRGDEGQWQLRWFTPTLEVDLCGHATLASAHALWLSKRADPSEPLVFSSRSGLLRAWRSGGWIELDFPARGERRCEAPADLIEGLGVMPVYVGHSEENDLLVEVDSGETLRGVVPDFDLLAALDARGIIVTCRSDRADYDFLSRFFAPASGVAEDPVTGSAHCCLAPYWSRRLRKDELLGYQASRRGGEVRVRLKGNRVILGGRAVTVAQGTLELREPGP